MTRTRARWRGGIAAWALLACAACDSGGERAVRAIEKTRDVEVVEPAVGHGVHGGGGAAAGGLLASASAPRPTYRWSTPDGWIEQPTSSLRQANFLVAGDERAECYLTVLPGDAGGLAPNVARWRAQMSLPALPADAREESMTTAELLGSDAVLVDFTGSYEGMSGEARPDHRLVGLLRVDPSGSQFLKMVGPADVVGPEIDAFLALARSLRRADAPPAAAPGGGADGWTWSTPAGWRRAPDRMMRLVTFHVGADEGAECYVSILGGDGGGVLANVNRWRGQVGLPGLTPAELAELERIPMLGGESVLVDVEGRYTGMRGETIDHALVLGAIGALPGRVVFVKMIGPKETLAAERDAFREFCASLEPATTR